MINLFYLLALGPSIPDDFISRALVLDTEGNSWTFLAPSPYSSPSPPVVAVRPVHVPPNHFVPSVLGVSVNDSYWGRLMRDHLDRVCSEADATHCYLLDDGGYIVHSNQVLVR